MNQDVGQGLRHDYITSYSYVFVMFFSPIWNPKTRLQRWSVAGDMFLGQRSRATHPAFQTSTPAQDRRRCSAAFQALPPAQPIRRYS
jgi:hypothetical protein